MYVETWITIMVILCTEVLLMESKVKFGRSLDLEIHGNDMNILNFFPFVPIWSEGQWIFFNVKKKKFQKWPKEGAHTS